MRALIVSTLILTALIVACDAYGFRTHLEEAQDSYCKWEWEDFNEFNHAIFDMSLRREKWTEYLRKREDRKNFTSSKGITHCSYVNSYGDRVFVLNDEQLFERLCLEEHAFGQFIESGENDALVNDQLRKLQENSRSLRKEFAEKMSWPDKECPARADIKLEETDKIRIPYKYFFDSCRNYVMFEYLYPKIRDLNSKNTKITKVRGLNKLENDAFRQKRSAIEGVREFCKYSNFDCCGRELVEEAVQTTSLRSVEWMIKDLSNEDVEKQIEVGLKEKNWTGLFENLCALEHKVTTSNQHYKIKSSTLHQLINKARTQLGQLLSRPTCPGEVGPASVGMIDITIDAACEEEVKSPIICRGLRAERVNAKHFSKDGFNEMFKYWCGVSEDVENRKLSPTKGYKPPNCSDKMRATIEEQAKAELAQRVEFLRLKKESDEAIELLISKLNGQRIAFWVLEVVEKHFKKVFKAEVDPLKKRQGELASELIKNKLEELKKSEGVKTLKH